MGIRYDGTSVRNNSAEIYEELFTNRGVKNISHFRTPIFEPLALEDRYSLMNEGHVWVVGDRYWKLADEYYGDSSLWWLIAWYNQKPTEGHLKIGDVLAIPLPLDMAMRLFYR
jgi:hypothetical protein|tara:strand:- start:5360 stop:5698 length:339 start_codon:yes stop_codon:yes gene_type:complete